uniref:Uncharacterized protein n=1 Tax=Cucumis melo TaxID=3656 RepID=A0A9I9CSF0_CUCME
MLTKRKVYMILAAMKERERFVGEMRRCDLAMYEIGWWRNFRFLLNITADF